MMLLSNSTNEGEFKNHVSIRFTYNRSPLIVDLMENNGGYIV